MIRDIVLFGDPVLREKGAKIDQITDEIRDLARDMIETMKDAEGVGLAAQQVGQAVQLAVVDVSAAEEPATYLRVNGEDAEFADLMPLVLLNPTVESKGGPATDVEGCLSFPDIRADIKRPGAIRARLKTLDGDALEVETDGLLARAIQHEVDHLHGILFIDRMSTAKKLSLRKTLKSLRQQGERAAKGKKS